MKKIRTPTKRAYYPASQNEPTRLLCWIPAEELASMVQNGQAPADHLDDYPDGLEIEVTEEDFDDFQITLDVSPSAIKQAYLELREEEQLPPSGMVDGHILESVAAGTFMPSFGIGETLPEPEMTDGEDPLAMLQGLK